MSLEKILGVDKVYCISLRKKENEWNSILENIHNNGFPSCVIFEGIDGKLYKDKLPQTVGVWEEYILKNGIQRTNHEQFSTYGAIGCYLSHTTIWKDMMENGYERVLIFEDDIWFCNNFIEKVKERALYIPEEYDFLFLDVAKSFSSTRVNRYFQRINELFFGLHAYIISSNAAKVLLPRIFPIEIQIDSYISYLGNLGNLNMYFTSDLCGQKIHFSSIQTMCNSCDVKKSGNNFNIIFALFFVSIFAFLIVAIMKPELFSRRK